MAAIVAAAAPGSCSGPNGSAVAKGRYGELRFGSICSTDWTSMFDDMAQHLVGLRDSFLVEQIPIQRTIRV